MRQQSNSNDKVEFVICKGKTPEIRRHSANAGFETCEPSMADGSAALYHDAMARGEQWLGQLAVASANIQNRKPTTARFREKFECSLGLNIQEPLSDGATEPTSVAIARGLDVRGVDVVLERTFANGLSLRCGH